MKVGLWRVAFNIWAAFIRGMLIATYFNSLKCSHLIFICFYVVFPFISFNVVANTKKKSKKYFFKKSEF